MSFNLADVLAEVSNLDTGREQIEYIRRNRIDPDPNNFYQLTDIEGLADNIELCGLQQPIRLRVNPDDPERYMIVSGHRRFAAIGLLAADDPECWAEVPCIVSNDVVSPTLQQLQLIFANSNTRKMSDAEIAEQAAQTKKLLYQLKEEEGYEFPGRMRDHVAEIVKISKSKLARLEMISQNLAAAWQSTWKDGTLTENAAYELSKMPKAYQSVLFEEKSRTNANLKNIYADDVKKFAERAGAIMKQSCSSFGGDCVNYENKLRKAAVAERWGWFHCDSKCCLDCEELLRCKRACSRLAETIRQRKADNKTVAKAAEEAKARLDKPKIDQISAIWQRFGLAREMAYKEFDDCKKAMDVYALPYSTDKMMRLECGEEKITAETYVPFGYCVGLSDVMKYVRLADLLGVSLDYLFCRTDDPKIGNEDSNVREIAGSSSWHPAACEPPTCINLVVVDHFGHADNGRYYGSGTMEDYCTIEWKDVAYWSVFPEDDSSAEVPASDCIGSFWHPGNECPDVPTDAVACFLLDPEKHVTVKRLVRWDGSQWCFNHGAAIELECIKWFPLPADDSGDICNGNN